VGYNLATRRIVCVAGGGIGRGAADEWRLRSQPFPSLLTAGVDGWADGTAASDTSAALAVLLRALRSSLPPPLSAEAPAPARRAAGGRRA
jgi:hypothetical protein